VVQTYRACLCLTLSHKAVQCSSLHTDHHHPFASPTLQPTYLVNTLEVDLTSAAQTALLPPVAGIAASACAGALGDALVKQGVPTAGVRKIAQAIGFLAPTAFLAYAAQVRMLRKSVTPIPWDVLLKSSPESPMHPAKLPDARLTTLGCCCPHVSLQAPDDSTTTVGCITAALGLCSFSLAGEHT
jgi:hypothetical protein